MNFLNYLANESSRNELLRRVNLVFNNVGELLSEFLPQSKGRGAAQGK